MDRRHDRRSSIPWWDWFISTSRERANSVNLINSITHPEISHSRDPKRDAASKQYEKRIQALTKDKLENPTSSAKLPAADILLDLGVTDIVKMNQLQNLLHDTLIATDHVQSCAIIRRKDYSVRASSVGFTLYQDQIQMLLDAFKNPPQTRDEGLYFDDKQYKCVRADKNSIYGKFGKRGLVLVKTTSLLIVATYADHMYPSVCVEAVEKLADYFKEKGK